ncbi:MAG: hypothetical protein HUK13_05790 [Muribaculaceae bacterium]|nr:hypothetical protein [Muribaculaceae bacterium]MCF0213943.1 hypothetical protein [Muribaculaceae bacterium]
MKPNEIISAILIRYKNLCIKYPQASSFVSHSETSFYMCQKRENNIPVQIRISDHGTYLRTWTDRQNLGDSTNRLLDPAICINISIVFVDEENGLTNDCQKRINCEGCKIEPCIPQTFDGQNEIGKPFKVHQYVYNSRYIAPRYINGITKAIMEARFSGEYKDPLVNLYRAARHKELISNKITENIQYNTMNNTKNRIRLTESQLHNIIKESVKNLLKEETYEFDDAQLFPQAVELAIELSDALRKIKIDTYGEKTVCIPIQQFSYIEDMSSQLHEIMHQLEEQSAFPRN